MMKKFHINPETGEASQCKARYQCPFGDASQHFDSPELAREAYETQMEEFTSYRNSPLGKLDFLTGRAIEKFRSGISKTVGWMNDNPKWVIAGLTTIGVVAGAIVAHKIASNYFAATTSTPFTGTILDGERVSKFVGVVGKGGRVDIDTVYKVADAAGEVFKYKSDSSTLIANGTELPLHLYSDGTVNAQSVADTALRDTVASTIGGGVVGGTTGVVSGILATMGIDRMIDFVDSKWYLRNEKRFGLLNWRT